MRTIPSLIAHRGASAQAPENTLIAFERAKQMDCDWVEFDVLLSQDNVPVVLHDETLDRTTNSTGFVWNHAWEDLQKLDAGSWFDPQFSDAKIPSLQQTLDLLIQIDLNANIEIKDTGDTNRNLGIAKQALSLIQNFNVQQDCIVSSYCIQTLLWLRDNAPDLNLALLYELDDLTAPTTITKITAQSQAIKPMAIHINQEAITSLKTTDQLKTLAPYLGAYTVNDNKRQKQLFDWGVDYLFSDLPKV